MKILYISKFDLPDFMNDMVFHGLRSLFGEDVVDSNEAWYMYDDFRKYWYDRVPGKGMEYGRGFTLYGRLPKLNIDRTDLRSKIKNHYFDKIVFGSIWRNLDYFIEIQSEYNSSDIIFIDGEDNIEIRSDLLHKGEYYKRELMSDLLLVKPINFCIPKDLIVKEMPKKEKDYANIIPGNKSTYIYTEEQPYYEDYQKSYFGVTVKKGGWDCLRHYEILMNGCIPFWFSIDEEWNLENCPKTTMMKFPKKLILSAMDQIKKGNDLSFYEECVNLLLEHTKNKLTTEAVAKELII